MVEEWRDIVIEKNGVIYDYTGLYQVSNHGRVRSLNYNHTGEIQMLKLSEYKNGYLRVCLVKNKKRKDFLVHRLVGFAFSDLIPNNDPINKIHINHIDENKHNNHVENLEWVTQKQNNTHGTRVERQAKSISKKVRCVETGEIFESIIDVERKLGLPNTNIGKCCKGKQKTCGGFHWMYLDEYLKESN